MKVPTFQILLIFKNVSNQENERIDQKYLESSDFSNTSSIQLKDNLQKNKQKYSSSRYDLKKPGTKTSFTCFQRSRKQKTFQHRLHKKYKFNIKSREQHKYVVSNLQQRKMF